MRVRRIRAWGRWVRYMVGDANADASMEVVVLTSRKSTELVSGSLETVGCRGR